MRSSGYSQFSNGIERVNALDTLLFSEVEYREREYFGYKEYNN